MTTFRLLIVITAAILLNACGTTKPSAFYALDNGVVPEESVSKTADDILIGIESVVIPNYLDRPQIVTRDADGVRLTVSEFNRWGESLSDVFPRALGNAINLKSALSLAKQINLNRDLFPYRLFVEVLRFDAVFEKEAVLETYWTIMTNSGRFLYRSHSAFVEKVGGSYADVVAAEQKLVQKLGDEVAAYALKNLVKGTK